jgi:hypothetical protein
MCLVFQYQRAGRMSTKAPVFSDADADADLGCTEISRGHVEYPPRTEHPQYVRPVPHPEYFAPR